MSTVHTAGLQGIINALNDTLGSGEANHTSSSAHTLDSSGSSLLEHSVESTSSSHDAETPGFIGYAYSNEEEANWGFREMMRDYSANMGPTSSPHFEEESDHDSVDSSHERPAPSVPNRSTGRPSNNAGGAQAPATGRSSKVDGKNDLDKAFKEQAENNTQYQDTSKSNSEGGDVFTDQLNTDVLGNQLNGVTNPDDDRGRRLYQKASFNQRAMTEQKNQEVKAGTVNLGTLTGKGDVRTNERLMRVYAGDSTTVGLSDDLKVGNHESVESEKSSYAGFVGAQLQHNVAAARYEGTVETGPVKLKPKAEALVGTNVQLEAQVQAGKNPNIQLDGQFFFGARVDGEVGLEVFNKKLRKPAASGTTAADGSAPTEPKRLLKMKARVDASVAVQANTSVLFGRAQKDGETITGAGGSVDLFAGARTRGKLTAEAAGVGVAAQVEALAGVGITVNAGLKKVDGTYIMTHGFGMAAGVGVGMVHEVTFNPALLKEAISGVIPKLGEKTADSSAQAVSAETLPNKLRKPRPQPAPARIAPLAE